MPVCVESCEPFFQGSICLKRYAPRLFPFASSIREASFILRIRTVAGAVVTLSASATLHLGRGELKLIRRLDVRDLTENVHQLRQIEELRKARARPIARSLRSQLNRCRGFAKRG